VRITCKCYITWQSRRTPEGVRAGGAPSSLGAAHFYAKSHMPDALLRDVGKFEKLLGLPKGFYIGLFDEGDWSFVIKLNALFEAACTHALVARLRAPEIEDQLAQLELADSAKGKVKLLATLGSLTTDQATFLRKLAELRNQLVHNVSRVTFDYEQYVHSLDRNQREQFVKVFGRGWSDPVELHGKKIRRSAFVLENPKLSVWFHAIDVFGCLYVELDRAKLRFEHEVMDSYQSILGVGVIK
jgi:hypothetical protein